MTLENFRSEFLPVLRTYLEKKADHLSTVAKNSLISLWLQHMVELSQGGKCLRPYLIYTFYTACGGRDTSSMLQTSIFSEIFHLFALVHDDIIDEGRMRHGLETQHKYIESSLIQKGRTGKLAPCCRGQALLIGDLLLSWTANIIARAQVRDMNRAAVQEAYQEMVETVMIGEMLDVDLCTQDMVTSEQIIQKSLLKSGHYSMLHPLVLGAAFADSSQGMQLAREVGHHWGLAFQIQDDYLDIVGDAKHVGKVVMNDLAEGQHTFFTQHVAENGNEEQKNLLSSLKLRQLNDAEIQQAREIFEQSGALSSGKTMINDGYSRAQELLHSADFLLEEPKNDLIQLIEIMKSRIK